MDIGVHNVAMVVERNKSKDGFCWKDIVVITNDGQKHVMTLYSDAYLGIHNVDHKERNSG